jgi:hypothetical protein
VIINPSVQQIAMLDSESGELQERRLKHREEAEQFYRTLTTAAARVRVGMEASGHAAWFERLLAELKIRVVGWRRSCDQSEASTQAEDGSARCAAYSKADAERRFS